MSRSESSCDSSEEDGRGIVTERWEWCILFIVGISAPSSVRSIGYWLEPDAGALFSVLLSVDELAVCCVI